MTILLNPKRYVPTELDEASAALMRKTIAFFESKGKKKLKDDDRERVWYADFLGFVEREQVFAKLLTPAAYGGGDPDARWDTHRNCEFNEITAFYALHYWYTDVRTRIALTTATGRAANAATPITSFERGAAQVRG